MKTNPYSLAALAIAGCIAMSACDHKRETADKPAEQTSVADVAPGVPPAPTSTAAPLSTTEVAARYNGKVIHQPDAGRGKDDGWFLVGEGKRRWITDAAWAAKNGYKAEEVIYVTSEEFQAIPEDPRPLPESEAAQP